ncbi:MAG: hypothetical protein WA966_14840 [Ornithinimicrobium sp.]
MPNDEPNSSLDVGPDDLIEDITPNKGLTLPVIGPASDAEPSPKSAGSLRPKEVLDLDEAGHVDPVPGLVHPHETLLQRKREDARRWIALALIFMLFVLVAVGCWGWISHGSDVERMQNFAVLFSPVVTLLGTVLGFYFSSADGRR